MLNHGEQQNVYEPILLIIFSIIVSNYSYCIIVFFLEPNMEELVIDYSAKSSFLATSNSSSHYFIINSINFYPYRLAPNHNTHTISRNFTE